MRTEIYNKKVWVDRFINKDQSDPNEAERIDRILKMAPLDIRTALDVGVGGGCVYRRLKNRSGIELFGTDISMELIRAANDGSMCVSCASRLPYRSGQFDLVLAADLIEHIDEDRFQDVISEIARVSGKYILFSSPYRDVVEWPVAKCGSCGCEFNIYGHMRTIDMALIRTLFPTDRYDIVRKETFGLIRHFRPAPLVRLARRYGKVYSKEPAVCPKCFSTTMANPQETAIESFTGRAVYGAFNLMNSLTPPGLRVGSKICLLMRKKGKV